MSNAKVAPTLTIRQIEKLLTVAWFTPMGTTFTDGDMQWGLPLMLVSGPGLGKTSVVRRVAKRMLDSVEPAEKAGLEAVPGGFVSFEPGAVGEAGFGVTPVPVEVDAGLGSSAGNLALSFPPLADLVSAFSDRGGLLFLDEASTARGGQLDALLTCLQYGKIGTYQLNPRVRRMGAMNPSEQTASGELLPIAVMNRLCFVNFPLPQLSEFTSYLGRAGRTGAAAGDEEAPIHMKKQEAKVLADWPKAYAAAVAAITAFITAQPQYMYTPPKSTICGPWTSPRSLEYVCRALSACTCFSSFLGEDRAIVEDAFVTGCISPNAAVAMTAYRESLDLPNLDDILSGASTFTSDPKRLDITAAVLSGLSIRVEALVAEKALTPGHAEILWDLLERVGAHAADLTMPLTTLLFQAKYTSSKAAMRVLQQTASMLRGAA